MKNILECTNSKCSLYKKQNIKSEQLKEILYGERFKKIKSINNFWYGYAINDKYYGYVLKRNFAINIHKKTHKIIKKISYLYKKPSLQFKTKKFLYLNSLVKINQKKGEYVNVGTYWIKSNNIEPVNRSKKKSDLLNKVKFFMNTPYVWGGNTTFGIDCSGLIQELFKNLNLSCPRDSKDQMKFFKKKIKLGNIKKGDLLFWKGHVAIAISKKFLIHAYGPKKRVVRMSINQVIKELKNKNLELISIKRP